MLKTARAALETSDNFNLTTIEEGKIFDERDRHYLSVLIVFDERFQKMAASQKDTLEELYRRPGFMIGACNRSQCRCSLKKLENSE